MAKQFRKFLLERMSLQFENLDQVCIAEICPGTVWRYGRIHTPAKRSETHALLNYFKVLFVGNTRKTFNRPVALQQTG